MYSTMEAAVEFGSGIVHSPTLKFPKAKLFKAIVTHSEG